VPQAFLGVVVMRVVKRGGRQGMVDWTAVPKEDPEQIEGGEPDRSPEGMKAHALDTARSLIATVIGQVAALVDAVDCDTIEDGCWRCDLALPTLAFHPCAENGLVCSSAADSPREHRAEGYIGLSMLHVEQGVRACGGHYDRHHRPRAIHEEDLPLNGLTHERLGQVLMNIHARVIRGHVASSTEGRCDEGGSEGTLSAQTGQTSAGPGRLPGTTMGTMEGGDG